MKNITELPQPVYLQRKVVDILKKAALNELLTSTLYRLLETSPSRYISNKLKHMARTARRANWRHYQALLGCIGHLLKGDTQPTLKLVTPPALPHIGYSPIELLDQIEQAEQASIDYEQEICALTMGYDYKVFDQTYVVLNENIEHCEQVKAYLHPETV